MKCSVLSILISSVILSNYAIAEDATKFDEVVVTAKKYTQPVTVGEPAKTVVDSEQIEEKQYSNIAEIVESTTGATLDGGARSGGERINIRGFSKPSDIGVSVDGAPIGFQQYQYGTFFFDPFLIGETEINKGAFDYKALNGKFGGTIKLKTKSVDDLLDRGQQVGARVSTGYNSTDGSKTYGVSLYGRANSGIYFLLNGSFKDANDVTLADGTILDYSAYNQSNALIKVGYKNLYHSFEISHTTYVDDGIKPWSARRGKMPKITKYKIKKYGSKEMAKYAYTVDNHYQDNTTTATYKYHPANPLINVEIIGAKSSNERHWKRPKIANKMFISVGNYGHEADTSYERDYFDVSNDAIIDDHKVTTGVQYEKTDRNSEVYNRTYRKKASKNFGHYTPYFEPSGTQVTYGVYVADQYQITDKLSVTPSLRYEYVISEGKGNAAPDYNNPKAGHDYSEITHSGASARLSVDYDIIDSTTLNFSYANAMKAPTIDNIYSVQYARATATATARDLKESRINAYQISAINESNSLFVDNDVLATEITAFYYDVSNTVGNRKGANLDKKTNNLQSWKINLDGTKTYGLEITSQYRLSDFYSDFSLSYMRGKTKGSLKDSTGPDEDLAAIPPLNINVALGYEWFDGFKTGWGLNWYDAQTKTGTDLFLSLQPSEQYTLQNIYAKWDIKQASGLSIGVNVDNLTNRSYKPYLADGVPAAGREVTLYASYKY